MDPAESAAGIRDLFDRCTDLIDAADLLRSL
jgi:hypothetical protein